MTVARWLILLKRLPWLQVPGHAVGRLMSCWRASEGQLSILKYAASWQQRKREPIWLTLAPQIQLFSSWMMRLVKVVLCTNSRYLPLQNSARCGCATLPHKKYDSHLWEPTPRRLLWHFRPRFFSLATGQSKLFCRLSIRSEVPVWWSWTIGRSSGTEICSHPRRLYSHMLCSVVDGNRTRPVEWLNCCRCNLLRRCRTPNPAPRVVLHLSNIK